jgi:hypothetical protein
LLFLITFILLYITICGVCRVVWGARERRFNKKCVWCKNNSGFFEMFLTFDILARLCNTILFSHFSRTHAQLDIFVVVVIMYKAGQSGSLSIYIISRNLVFVLLQVKRPPYIKGLNQRATCYKILLCGVKFKSFARRDDETVCKKQKNKRKKKRSTLQFFY